MREREEHQQLTQASVLDRLIDEQPGTSYEPVQDRLATIGQIKASVVRDLENLLNTRRHISDPGSGYHEVSRSLYMYGLADFIAKNPRSKAVQQELRSDVERTIAFFEPRLQNVSVHIETDKEKDQNVHFRISGLLVMESETEPVMFDTYFDLSRGEYVIEK